MYLLTNFLPIASSSRVPKDRIARQETGFNFNILTIGEDDKVVAAARFEAPQDYGK